MTSIPAGCRPRWSPFRRAPAVVAATSIAVALLVSAAPSAAGASAADAGSGHGVVWLCRPGTAGNACNQDADGAQQHRVPGASTLGRYPDGHLVSTDAAGDDTGPPPPAAPKADCFGVYPTVDLVHNAGAAARPADVAVVLTQMARFAPYCRLFVPVYRQQPVLSYLGGGIVAGVGGTDLGDALTDPDKRRAFDDVERAFDDYLAHDNDGRSIVLLGHSQGTDILVRLLAERFDGDTPAARALRDRLVSAVVPGGHVTVPVGRAGGPGSTFRNLPLCERAGQTGCVVAYSGYAQPESGPGSVTPLPDDAVFGRVADPGRMAACVNPAALLAGAPATSTVPAGSELPTSPLLRGTRLAPNGELSLVLGRFRPPAAPTIGPGPPPGFVGYRGALTTSCVFLRVAGGTQSWLQVRPAVPEPPGGAFFRPAPDSIGGLHVMDVNLALGDLVALVRGQIAAYGDAH